MEGGRSLLYNWEAWMAWSKTSRCFLAYMIPDAGFPVVTVGRGSEDSGCVPMLLYST